MIRFILDFRGDMFAEDSIELLKTSGIDFAKFEELGIDVHRFGELMMMSGLVLNPDVKWVSFHSSYDFGYLVKTLTCRELPLDEPAFMDSLHTYFPCIYDVKVMKTLNRHNSELLCDVTILIFVILTCTIIWSYST